VVLSHCKYCIHKNQLLISAWLRHMLPATGAMCRALQHRHAPFLAAAATLALQSDMQHRHGCVLVDDARRIVGKGFNHRVQRGHPLGANANTRFSVHAEEAALRDYYVKRKRYHVPGARALRRKRRPRVVMYVVRVGWDAGELVFRCSKPCAKCQQQIEGASNVVCTYFTTSPPAPVGTSNSFANVAPRVRAEARLSASRDD
jgi:deoxycytidylate deaminase